MRGRRSRSFVGVMVKEILSAKVAWASAVRRTARLLKHLLRSRQQPLDALVNFNGLLFSFQLVQRLGVVRKAGRKFWVGWPQTLFQNRQGPTIE